MQASRDIAERSDYMVTSCGLDSMSIFFRNRLSLNAEGLSYLYHNGVSGEAQDAYMAGRVYEDDPFTRAIEGRDRKGQLIRWEDGRLARLAQNARDYRSFISCYEVDVIGAWVQQVVPDLFLVIGAHCRPGGHRRTNVPMGLLEKELAGLSQMVVSHLLEVMLQGVGPGMLDAVLQGEQSSAQDAMASLSQREQEIARFVGEGKQNKQIAYLIGISEFTVENHLRRIYRKLEVRNRTAMTARLFERPTFQ